MSEKKAVIGIIGCGAIAKGVHLGNAFSNPRIRVKACCDLFEDNLEYVKKHYTPEYVTKNAEDVINDPEIEGVLILTTHKYRLELIRAAAEAGKHIFVEKPMSVDPEESYQIMRAVRLNNVKLVVGFNRRLAPIVKDAVEIYRKNLVSPCSPPWRYRRYGNDAPKLPELDTTQVLMRINDDAASFKRYIFDEYESMGGIMVGEMCHFVDLACHILGKEPVKVYAEGWARMNMSIVLTFEDKSVCTILDSCNGSFDHPKELIEIYSNGMSMQLDHYLQLRVGGRDDVYKIDYPFSSDPYPEITEGEGTNLYINKVRERNRGISDTKDFGYPDVNKGHYNLLDGFVDCIISDAPSPADELAGSRATLIVCKAKESVRTGLPVKISEDEYNFCIAHGRN